MIEIRNWTFLPTEYGECKLYSFNDLCDSREHVALVFKDANTKKCPLVRLHSECLTGEVFGSSKCDCGPQLQEAIAYCAEHGGIILYLRQEGRDIGLYNKIDAYKLQCQGYDTFEANLMLEFPEDSRNFEMAAQMLKALGVEKIDLLSNNPDKLAQLVHHGIHVKNRISTGVYATLHNQAYLEAKHIKARHHLDAASYVNLF